MEIARDPYGYNLVVSAVRDQHRAGRQLGQVDIGVRIESLNFLQQVTRTLCVTLAPVLPEGFFHFRLRKHPLVGGAKALFDVREVARPVVEEPVAVLRFDPEKGRRVEVCQLC